ncbi:MAG TPA: TadE/TadG family type IV pilus assembly protein [Patescibacteria group bacterium]|nr:TadE/TadG family type IV pilus assembly protein [Patescibacteria group bacterium]
MPFSRSVWRFANDRRGAALVEATILIPFLFVFALGAVDFLFAFYQWSTAGKAVEVGARLAAVSNPVAAGLNALSTYAVSSGLASPGDPMPPFAITCNGSTSTCTCVGTVCTGISYDSDAMNTIVFGRDGKGQCGDAASFYFAGMCDVGGSVRIGVRNVQIVYKQSGLGYAGRPGGPVPTVTVSLLPNLKFHYFFLNSLMKFADIPLPSMTTTFTGEALSSAAQCPPAASC